MLRVKGEDLEVEPTIWIETNICIYTKIHDIDNQYQSTSETTIRDRTRNCVFDSWNRVMRIEECEEHNTINQYTGGRPRLSLCMRPYLHISLSRYVLICACPHLRIISSCHVWRNMEYTTRSGPYFSIIEIIQPG